VFDGLALLIVLIALPAMLLVSVVLWMAHSTRMSMRELAQKPCPVCFHPLGMAAVQRALARDVVEQQEYSEFSEAPASAAVDAAAFWTVDCPRCESELVWDHESRAWVHVTHPHQM
jgi:hypothetical protein